MKAGLTEVPALIYPLDRNQAAIAVVDSNIHREQILPSEKAFSYKLKMEAMKQQDKRTDLTLSQVATKLDAAAEIGKSADESRPSSLLEKLISGVISGFSPLLCAKAGLLVVERRSVYGNACHDQTV